MCQTQKNTAITGIGTVSVANPNLDGTGDIQIVYTVGDDTLIKSITIKALQDTTQGMVRLFLHNGDPTLWQEIKIPAVTQSATVPAFQTTIYPSFILQGADLFASTENGEMFNIIMDGISWRNCGCEE